MTRTASKKKEKQYHASYRMLRNQKKLMELADARKCLTYLVAKYFKNMKKDDMPNTPVALIDDFGHWLMDYRDDVN